MKRLKLVLIVLCVAALIPTASFAIGFDAGIYGGGHWSDYEGGFGGYDSGSPSGAEYGAIAHINFNPIPMALDIGFGAFYQRSSGTYRPALRDLDYNRESVGLDAYVELTLIPIVHPFARIGTNVWDNVAGNTANFESYYVGGGIFLKFLPFISLYGEAVYTFGSNDATALSVHGGVRFKI